LEGNTNKWEKKLHTEKEETSLKKANKKGKNQTKKKKKEKNKKQDLIEQEQRRGPLRTRLGHGKCINVRGREILSNQRNLRFPGFNQKEKNSKQKKEYSLFGPGTN